MSAIGSLAEEPGDEDGDEEETYTCAGTKADDSPCTREVEEEGAYCYQHGPDEE